MVVGVKHIQAKHNSMAFCAILNFGIGANQNGQIVLAALFKIEAGCGTKWKLASAWSDWEGETVLRKNLGNLLLYYSII